MTQPREFTCTDAADAPSRIDPKSMRWSGLSPPFSSRFRRHGFVTNPPILQAVRGIFGPHFGNFDHVWADRHHLRRPRAWHSHKRIFILKFLNKGKDKFLDFVFIEFGPCE